MRKQKDTGDPIQRILKRFEGLTTEDWERLFESIRKEGKRYIYIFNFKGDVSQDEKFHRYFNGFYKVRKNLEWRKKFYAHFHELRNVNTHNLELGDILRRIHAADTDRWEYSFSTKMLHTLDVDRPIIDSKVTKLLDIRFRGKKDIENFTRHYAEYEALIKKLLSTEDMRAILIKFDQELPELKDISKTKKLDFMMWKFRAE